MLAAGEAARADPLDASALKEIGGLYRTLIDAENRHDLSAVRQIVWRSPDTLFVAKTATPAEGNWAGFWGADVVIQHFAELYAGTFVMAPHYDRVRTVGLTPDVAETYAPLDITVSYAGQTPAPKPFLMIVTWIRTSDGWKMATDVALPIPPAPANKS
jgi:ketosteroid isomerase-like protein